MKSKDTVFILGAGVSKEAGIPLMKEFIDRMSNLASQEQTHDGQRISAEDLENLKRAVAVQQSLDRHQARVVIDRWDIEQIVSNLSFEASLHSGKAQEDLSVFTRAIAKTVELTCKIPPRGTQNTLPAYYYSFWPALIKAYRSHASLPTIISFNYDLVLERLLHRYLTPRRWVSSSSQPAEPRPIEQAALRLTYASDLFPDVLAKLVNRPTFGGPEPAMNVVAEDWDLVPAKDEGASSELLVRLLKVHGSLNFSREYPGVPPSENLVDRLTSSVPDPVIVPPVWDKVSQKHTRESWIAAHGSLRECRNLIICGYSMPKSDAYMEFFLKSALGPTRFLVEDF